MKAGGKKKTTTRKKWSAPPKSQKNSSRSRARDMVRVKVRIIEKDERWARARVEEVV